MTASNPTSSVTTLHHPLTVARQLIAKAMNEGHSFSLWRLPHSNKLHLIICEEPRLVEDLSLEESEPGFLIAPFLPDAKRIFLPGGNLYEFVGDRVYFQQREIDFQALPTPEEVRYHYAPTPQRDLQPTAQAYQTMVREGVAHIEQGFFEKVVPSRRKFVERTRTSDLVASFGRLAQRYSSALVSLVSTPQTGTWLGATPELLVKVDAQNWFHTVALAGTQPFQEGHDLRAISWTQKEIEEQAMVTRYIINCFKKIRLREFDEHGPKTAIAGNVLHLKTELKADMTATNFPQLGTVMVKLLHPTSAVCGMPHEPAMKFLQEHEGYNRELYAGYWGPVNVQQETQLYVNLRCMQVFENEACLYAGAGVTFDSDPDKEFEETELKMKTLLNVIQS